MASHGNSTLIPLYRTRIVSCLLSVVFGAITVAAAFHAHHESQKTKAKAQAAVQQLTPGVKLTINTTDVYTAGVVDGIAQLGLILLSLTCIGLLLTDARKRYAVADPSSQVRTVLWSTETLILQVLCYGVATAFCIAAAIVTTVFVATRQAKVSSILPNGQPMSQTLIDAFQKILGISPVYKKQDYLVFLAVAPWFGVVCSIISLIIVVIAWRRHPGHSNIPEQSNSIDRVERNFVDKD